jgi:hypothetical protein
MKSVKFVYVFLASGPVRCVIMQQAMAAGSPCPSGPGENPNPEQPSSNHFFLSDDRMLVDI